MEKLHIQKVSYDGYCVGTGVEYPGIIVSAKSDKALIKQFSDALPGHKQALKKHVDSKNIEVIDFDSPRVD